MGYRDPDARSPGMRGDQGRGRLGGGLHRAGGNPSDLGDHALHRAAPLGRPATCPALARIAEAIHRHGALAGIELAYNGMNGAEPLHPRGADGPGASAHRHLHRRSGPGPRHGQGGYPQSAPLASPRGAARQAAPASTSSMSMPPTASARCSISCRGATTTAATNMAAAWRTACACCARSSRTRRRPSATAAPSPCASPSTS